MDVQGRRPLSIPIWLLAALPPLFWAGNFVLARALHAEIPPLALSFWRWVGALLILLPFTWRGLWRERELLARHWRLLAFLALLGITVYNSMVYLGLQHTTATNAVLLNSVVPVMIVGLSFLLLRLAVRGAQLGLASSCRCWASSPSPLSTGRGFEGRPQELLDLRLNRGDLWVLAAGLDWALYSVCVRWRPQGLAPATFLAAIVLIGRRLPPLAGLYAWELSTGRGEFALDAVNLG